MAYANTLLKLAILTFALIPIATSFATDNSRATESWPEGFTQPIATVHLAASEAGVIDRILVREGDSVQAGDTIAQLRCEVLQATRQATLVKLNSTGQCIAAAATLAHRENHLTQLKALREQSHASEQEVAEAEFNVRLAEAQLQTAEENIEVLEAELKQIEAQIARRKIRAPFAGIVSELPIQAGERVGADDKPVAELVCLDQLRVRYYLPTAIVSSIRVGDSKAIYFPETDRSAAAIVDFVAPTTDSSSGTVRVELLIENQTDKFRAGVRCQLQLDSENDHEQFASLLRLRVRTLSMKTITHGSPDSQRSSTTQITPIPAQKSRIFPRRVSQR